MKRKVRAALSKGRAPTTPDHRVEPPFDVIGEKRDRFQERLTEIKTNNPIDPADGCWYPHRVLGNFDVIGQTLTGVNRDFLRLAGNRPVADIGGADGDLSFFLETLGINDIHLIESAGLNCSRLSGARILKRELNSAVSIHDIDVDREQILPEIKFGLVFFLGTLYHLKDPFRILEYLAARTEYCLLSTRVTRYLPGGKIRIDNSPVAYLLGPGELNDDPSNYFIFSHKGLRRLCERTGWEIADWKSFDNTVNSTPDSLHNGERVFCLLRSRVMAG